MGVRFCIADSFPKALAKLPAQDQKSVKTTVFDLQMDSAHPSLQFHRIDKSKDPNFWSVRVSRDVRLIVHKTEDSFLLCYVDHHDKAYQWAERRRIETHPKTGAAQLVEVRETVKEIAIPRYIEVASSAPISVQTAEPAVTPKEVLFGNLSDDQLLGYGVPAEWLADV